MDKCCRFVAPSSRNMLLCIFVSIFLASLEAAQSGLHANLAAGSSGLRRNWPVFPVPSSLVTVDEIGGDYSRNMLIRTFAGTAANQARKNGGGPMVWIQPSNWLPNFTERTKIPLQEGGSDLFALVEQFFHSGIVKGYVLYSQPSGCAETSTLSSVQDLPEMDVSVNIATSLCGVLGGVALDEKLAKEAEARGIPLLADARGQSYTWLLENYGGLVQRGEGGLVQISDPRRTDTRDLAVATGAVVTFNYASNGGFIQALQFIGPEALVFGWGPGSEEVFVNAATVNGMGVVASDWTTNFAILSSGNQSELSWNLRPPPATDGILDFLQPTASSLSQQSSIHSEDTLSGSDTFDALQNHTVRNDTRYVAFAMGDGDNLQWVTGGFIGGSGWWAAPERGCIPFGWGLPLSSLMQLVPDALEYLLNTSTPLDEFMVYGDPYNYVDRFASLRSGSPAIKDKLLGRMIQRVDGWRQLLGLRTLGVFAERWSSPAAVSAYQVIANNAPGLKGIFSVEYDDYAAGRGKILWVNRTAGQPPMPVVAPKILIWNFGQAENRRPPPPDGATVLNCGPDPSSENKHPLGSLEEAVLGGLEDPKGSSGGLAMPGGRRKPTAAAAARGDSEVNIPLGGGRSGGGGLDGEGRASAGVPGDGEIGGRSGTGLGRGLTDRPGGSPAYVAEVLNQWAIGRAKTLEDRYAWVSVSAWSLFGGGTGEEAGGVGVGGSKEGKGEKCAQEGSGSLIGYGAALNCSRMLSPNIKLVSPSALLAMIQQDHLNGMR